MYECFDDDDDDFDDDDDVNNNNDNDKTPFPISALYDFSYYIIYLCIISNYNKLPMYNF